MVSQNSMYSRLYLNGHAFDFKFKISITFLDCATEKEKRISNSSIWTVVVCSIFQKKKNAD